MNKLKDIPFVLYLLAIMTICVLIYPIYKLTNTL